MSKCLVCRKVFLAKDIEHVLDLVGTGEHLDSSGTEIDKDILHSVSEKLRRQKFEEVLRLHGPRKNGPTDKTDANLGSSFNRPGPKRHNNYSNTRKHRPQNSVQNDIPALIFAGIADVAPSQIGISILGVMWHVMEPMWIIEWAHEEVLIESEVAKIVVSAVFTSTFICLFLLYLMLIIWWDWKKVTVSCSGNGDVKKIEKMMNEYMQKGLKNNGGYLASCVHDQSFSFNTHQNCRLEHAPEF
ncbi:RWD domain-containing protein [Striga hermonthica]|uniref:RWD domain-containing protein n=1 Tax=Striga hermonthica TaxID=68872 RepID=A0A9N7NZD5_STRHE|nr:RWD domain-containing protein [Striga hermonthica]